MTEVWRLLDTHFKDIALGIGFAFGFIGLLKERITELVAKRRARHDRRRTEENLAEIPADASVDEQLQMQQRLSSLKIKSGEVAIGVKELVEISRRTKLGDETRRQLARLLVRNHPSAAPFNEILELLCRNRASDYSLTQLEGGGRQGPGFGSL